MRGTNRRVLLTSFGRVEVALRLLCCRQCGARFRPAECCLAEVSGHNVTADWRELAALVGSSWPYETAAGILHRLSGVPLSDERFRQLTNERGRERAGLQQAQADQLLEEAVNMIQVRAEREARQSTARHKPSGWLQVGLDGGWVCSREQKGGHGRQNRRGGQSG